MSGVVPSSKRRVARIHAAAAGKILGQLQIRIRPASQQRLHDFELGSGSSSFRDGQRRIVFIADVDGRVQRRASLDVGQVRIRAAIQQELGERVLLVHDGDHQGGGRRPRRSD